VLFNLLEVLEAFYFVVNVLGLLLLVEIIAFDEACWERHCALLAYKVLRSNRRLAEVTRSLGSLARRG